MSLIKTSPPKKKAIRSYATKLKTLMRQRANILGSAALIKRFNEQYQEGQVHQVRVRIDSLDQLWADFASVQDDIEEIEHRADGDEQQLSHASSFASQSCPSPPPPQVVTRSSDPVTAFSYSVVVAPSSSPVGSFAKCLANNFDKQSPPMASYISPKKDTANENEVFLSTVVVKVKDIAGNSHFIRGILDSCSQANFISEALARRLELKRNKTNMDVSGIGQGVVHIRSKVHMKISSRFGKFEYSLECLVIPHITVTLPSKHIDISRWNIPANIPLADPRFNISAGVDLLIGADIFYSLLESHKVLLSEGYPTLQRTVFGYVVAGKLLKSSNSSPICIVSASKVLDSALQRFWEVENFDNDKTMTPLEQACESHFKETVSRSEDGRYVVRLPLREELLPFLGESYAVAQRRFLAIERKFSGNKEFKMEYVSFMEEYRNLGHMELSPRAEHPQFVLPHHAIHRPESSTTKTRIVFDATCKGTTQLSLNDILLVGPIVQPSLLTIVLNFRSPKFVFIADIEKMFRQVWVHPADRKLQQVLWRSDTSQPVHRYQLTTITYGTASAPYLATRVLNQLAEDEGAKFPLGARIIREGFYVDDVLTGSDDIDELIESSKQLSQPLELAGFRLRKWCSNKPQIIAHIPDQLKESLPLTEIDRSTTVKTLGLLWSHDSDHFGFKIPHLPKLSTVSKRIVVSEMAQLFDPLGLVGAVIVSAKIFVQQLWAMNLSWDEELPAKQRDWWFNLRNEITKLAELQIPRRVIANTEHRFALHCFCDASQRGYGACVYVVSSDASEVLHSYLLISKSRVAPLRGLTIPKLELCAALLGSQLVAQVEMKRGIQDFWKRWSRDYVSELHQRSKWQYVRDEVKVGSLVLLKQENAPPLQWNLGRIVTATPGDDGHVRVVEVRTAKGIYKRAITEVYLLPLDAQESVSSKRSTTTIKDGSYE
ncbi:uncharacterized protein LOC131429350 [Malaya genurostris]|uniref:uncharacterized protein LOC131429350 n=1 Tax=Malaya genurostris TaxID=325434 RepID=UPI0026F38E3A|nr:uncharacterized protein LOC131429350 [Malaya genurostris]